MTAIDGTTLSFDKQPTEAQSQYPVFYLSIVYHPDSARIGQCAALPQLGGRGWVELSRTTPLFFPPNALLHGEGSSLNDPYLSRTPIYVKRIDEQQLRVTCQQKHDVRIQGHRVTEQNYPLAEIQRGLVMECGGRVALLLHSHVPSTINEAPIPDCHGIIGCSAAINGIRRLIDKLAPLDVGVLIRGESGTGKELVAQALHAASARAGRPFIRVNMAAIPESLAASTLFGARKGAFTGSDREHKGVFREAHQGTLFLDEIGDIPDSVQTTLLRALENGEIQPVGGAGPQTVDVRVVAATDAALEEKIASGRFRNPLLQRLAACEIQIPSLRERRQDIAPLTHALLTSAFESTGQGVKLTENLADSQRWSRIFATFCLHHWPGNVRQLAHVAKQIAIHSRGETGVVLPPEIEKIVAAGDASRTDNIPHADAPRAIKRPKDIADGELEQVLRKNHWDVKAAADMLNISRASLYGLVDRHPTLRRARDIPNEEFIAAFHSFRGELDAIVAHLKLSKQAVRRRLREIEQQGYHLQHFG